MRRRNMIPQTRHTPSPNGLAPPPRVCHCRVAHRPPRWYDDLDGDAWAVFGMVLCGMLLAALLAVSLPGELWRWATGKSQ